MQPATSLASAPPPDRAARLAAVEDLRDLLRKQGHNSSLVDGARAETEGKAKEPENILDLPILTSLIGTLGMIAGEWSSGKTTVALTQVARVTRSGRWAAVVDGRGWIYPPALTQLEGDLEKTLLLRPTPTLVVWAAEQVLRSGLFALVVVLEPRLDRPALRRLQLAAEQGSATGLVVPHPAAAFSLNFFSTRLRITAHRSSPEELHPQPRSPIAAPPRRCGVDLDRRGASAAISLP